MSDRPTPETDAATREIPESGHYSALILRVVSADKARRLERERDEARELARELRDALADIRDMPEIDQDDEHRLRHKAKKALAKAKEVLP